MATTGCDVIRSVLFACLISAATGYVLNIDPLYARWPNKQVPYVFQPNDLSEANKSLIRAAMRQISTDMGNCMIFVELPAVPTNGQNYVIISQAGAPVGSTPAPTCFSYPGMYYQQNGRGQYLSMQGGPNGCLANIRQAMRLLVSALGLRSEHNKPGRDSFININQGVATPVAVANSVFNIYDATKVLYNSADFDYNSITALDPPSFSQSGQAVLTSKTGPVINNTGRLSLKDCQALSYQYSCTVVCQNVYGTGPLPTQQPATTRNPFNPVNPGVPVGPVLPDFG